MTSFFGSESCLPNCCIRVKSLADFPLGPISPLDEDFNEQHKRRICEALDFYGRVSSDDRICVFSKSRYRIAHLLGQYCTLMHPIKLFEPQSANIHWPSFAQTYQNKFNLIIIIDCLHDIENHLSMFACLKACLDPFDGRLLVLHRCSMTLTLPVPKANSEEVIRCEYSASNLLSDMLKANLDIEWDVFRIVFSLPALSWIKMLRDAKLCPLDCAGLSSQRILNGISSLVDSQLKYTPQSDIHADVQLSDNLLIIVAQGQANDALSLTKLERSTLSYNQRWPQDGKKSKANSDYEFEIPIELASQVKSEMQHLFNDAVNRYEPKEQTTISRMHDEEWWGNTLYQQIATTDSSCIETRRLNSYWTKLHHNRRRNKDN
ncbi:hypothetical protein Ciccas_001738 [Cichlidogyrus casuarinus]|uniref:Uncharacterized protein n=1 Tax=Cichlidogyrus casuarinus TaxID=1844966 RepID=A0ABD2QJR0_9PLAT